VTVKWGLLSTARINRSVLSGAAESELADVIAVASRDAERATTYAREHEIPRAYGSYEELLDDPHVEAVYIPLPNALHVEWALRTLEAGKHVLCEKPFSRRPEDVERAFELAESNRLVLSEGFMWRHHPQTETLATLLAEGAIGRLRLVRAAFSFQLASVHGADDARFSPELDGGSLMDVGSYCVNAIRLLAGEPDRVRAEQVVGESGVDICFAGTLRCADDVLAQFDCGFVLPGRSALEVVGEAGSLGVGDPWHVRSPGIELRREGESEAAQIQIEPANSYRLELDDLCTAIRGESTPLLGREDAVGQARTIDALYRSAAGAGAVDLPTPTSQGSAA
jgi:xylose dehydrogenase (NAD/NADP)